MTQILLTKPQLPPDFIDTSVGEPYAVRECLSKLIDLDKGYIVADKDIWNYPSPQGYKPLVDLLEEKHKAKVIITSGAKQGLGACFNVLSTVYDKNHCTMNAPYWALIPPLSWQHNVATTTGEMNPNNLGATPHLLLAPNNPDGFCDSFDNLKSIYMEYHHNGIPFIHDAAYYTHTYLPSTYELGPLGDVQIFSISKSYGLSGLRLGYIVVHNETWLQPLLNYIEMMTVGVSTISQQMLYNLMCWAKYYPEQEKEFFNNSFNALQTAKRMVKTINKDVLEVPDNMEDIPGMFLWAKVGPKADFMKAKVNMIDGKHFGGPGYVRMNLALGETKLQEVINRLNSL